MVNLLIWTSQLIPLVIFVLYNTSQSWEMKKKKNELSDQINYFVCLQKLNASENHYLCYVSYKLVTLI